MIKSTFVYISLYASILWVSSSFAVDIFKTDKYFSDKQYELALKGYLDAAERGNPHAYYQLGNMYIKGLGVEQDVVNGILYFALAAQYDFHNAKKVLESILNRLPPENRQNVNRIINAHLENYSSDKLNKKYFPIIIEERLKSKLTFGNGEELQTQFAGEDFDTNDVLFDNQIAFDEEDQSVDFGNIIFPPKKAILIVDHDIYVDGSVRQTRQVQNLGGNETSIQLLSNLKQYPLAIPKMEDNPVEFISRAYLGAATFDKFSLLNDNPEVFHKVNRYIKKLKSDPSLNTQFEYATALINFPWLPQEEGDAEKILLNLSKQGHSPAMFEYGLLLYRTQTDIEQAIYWISESAKYGLTRAEYRLGKLLQSSPWVEYDPRKALYWFESAAEKGSNAAKIRAVDIKLTSKNIDLLDVDKASSYLSELKDSQSSNPEYFYLLAQSMRFAEQKDFKAIFSTLRKAISMGQTSNWDVSEWQDQLNTMMQGNISISEEGNCADKPELCG